MQAKDRDRDSATDANVESDPGDAPVGTHEIAPLFAPCRITVVHTRKRLADPDGLSAKAIIDGIVEAGILPDDSAKQITEVRHRQVKGSPETTRVIIEEV